MSIDLAVNTIGFAWAAIDYTLGSVSGKHPSVKFVRGGVVVQGGGLTEGGVTIGNIAVTEDHSKSTLRHESAHIEQYNEKGAIDYFSHLGSSPYNNRSGGRISTYENDADKRAGTWGGPGYQAHSNYKALFVFIATRPNSTTYNRNNDLMLYYYYDSKGTF